MSTTTHTPAQTREALTTALELADAALDNARWYIGNLSMDDAAERPLDCLSIALTEIYRAVKLLAEPPATLSPDEQFRAFFAAHPEFFTTTGGGAREGAGA